MHNTRPLTRHFFNRPICLVRTTVTLTITKIEDHTWYAGMLMDNFSGDGFTGKCHASIYRGCGMIATNITIKLLNAKSIWEDRAFATKPLDWTPKVGDTLEAYVPGTKV